MKHQAIFGPSGSSASFIREGHKHTYEAPAWLALRGLGAYEYPAGNGISGSETTFRKIGEEARRCGIRLSLHAPYFISLSGTDPEKRLKSVHYITQSVRAARWMGADRIVIHAGSAASISREEAMKLAADTLWKTLESLEQSETEEDRAKPVILGVETMGKRNQLGTLAEVLTLCKMDRRLRPVIDFGHLNARENGLFFCADDYRRVFSEIADVLGAEALDDLHCHFSKIAYTPAGEKCHLTFEDHTFGPDYEPLMAVLAADGLSPRVICESAGTMAEDALAMQNCYLAALSAKEGNTP